jgi:hypothetical protein
VKPYFVNHVKPLHPIQAVMPYVVDIADRPVHPDRNFMFQRNVGEFDELKRRIAAIATISYAFKIFQKRIWRVFEVFKVEVAVARSRGGSMRQMGNAI